MSTPESSSDAGMSYFEGSFRVFGLPVELREKILTFLPPKDLHRLEQTCREFGGIVKANNYFRYKCPRTGLSHRYPLNIPNTGYTVHHALEDVVFEWCNEMPWYDDAECYCEAIELLNYPMARLRYTNNSTNILWDEIYHGGKYTVGTYHLKLCQQYSHTLPI